ncbi:pyocin knob domain-containing protein [Bacillus haynesii]|uniref:pyocin knob domain-containing protein n=1 Tax=Bacillus haynesii TaxID=1925021 RepID=UPI00227DFDDB|nr:pyocin knob domain-containing protein [Bacillus haynesii]MCY8756471.1 pyocin knob domain-containing protein [Bacillus haynesii]
MDIQKPRRFETTDRAHADLFNEAIDQLNVNDERIAKRAEEAEEKAKTYTDAHASDQSIHITDKEREKWSAGQLYKITENNGKVFYRGSSETTDFNTLTETGMYLIYNEGINSPPSSNRIFLLVMSFGNTLVQAAYESYKGTQSYFRFRKSDSTTWTPWQTQETTSGAQAKVDAHERNTNLHVNEGEREKWNNAQLYKITDSNGTRTKLPDGTDLLTLPTGFYYAMGHVVQNNPAENDSSWFNYDVIETGAGRKTIHAWRSYDNTLWHGTVHTDGQFRGWKRVVTNADLNVAWQTPTLTNGWKQYGSHKVRFCKNVLGEVEVIGSITGGTIGFDVPAFTLPEGFRPIQMMHFVGVASSIGTGSTPQYHRTFIDTDGRVCIQSSSNTVNPNEFITFGFKFRAA